MSATLLVNRLRVYRALRRLTQQQLAELAGVSRRSVNAIENGEFTPSTVLAFTLARVLGIAITDLFRLADETGEWPLVE